MSLGKPDELSPDSRTNYNILKNLNHPNINIISYSSIKDIKYFNKCDAIIDAILGSGAEGPLKEPYSSIIKQINKLNLFKIIRTGTSRAFPTWMSLVRTLHAMSPRMPFNLISFYIF